MMIGELIALLKKFPSDRRVVVRNHEVACDGIAAPADVRLLLNVLADAWYGWISPSRRTASRRCRCRL